MAQLAVRRPFREFDLSDQLRPDPVRSLVRLRLRRKRTLRRFKRPEALHHALELAVVEAGAGVAGVDERVAFIHAQQEGAEVFAGVARLGPAADDELLLVDDLQLPPVGRSLAR